MITVLINVAIVIVVIGVLIYIMNLLPIDAQWKDISRKVLIVIGLVIILVMLLRLLGVSTI